MTHPSAYIPPDYGSPSTPSLLKALAYRKTIETMNWNFMTATLGVIRLLDSEDVVRFSRIVIPPYLRPTFAFLNTLSNEDHIMALRACLLVFTVTRGRLRMIFNWKLASLR
jgi:hypothetical protein